MKNQRRNSRNKTITFNNDEYEYIDSFATGLVKDLVDIEYKIKEVDEKYKSRR